MKLFVGVWIFFTCTFSSYSQDMYWTIEAKTAYSLLSSFRVDEALSIIRLQSITYPDNLIWPYLEDYADFIKVFVNEDLREMDALIETSIERSDRIALVPETNPLSLMAQGQMGIHRCALHMQQSEFVAAATDISNAFKLLKKNQRLHPEDVANLRLYASLKILFGAVPDQYRWLVAMFTSLQGTIDEGMKELYGILQSTTPKTNIYYSETVFFTALAEGRFKNNPAAGLQLVKKYFGQNLDNKTIQYITASLQVEMGETDAAIKTLTQNLGVQNALRIPFLDFMLGECKLFRGDHDADTYFKNFLLFHKGKHYIKEAHQKLAWYCLLNNDHAGYFNHMQQILIKGASTTDEDQQAMNEAETHATPHPVLLRSRLYYDGGYYEKADALLTESLYGTLNQQSHRIEYMYRKGRILQAKKSYAEALHYLNLTISKGQFEKYYYSCSAALQCGLIHEKLGSEPTAAKYYYMCLEMVPDTYANSLHQKARMGLNRVGE